MRCFRLFGLPLVMAGMLAAPALAQSPPTTPPTLGVATVRLEHGWRASKLLGAGVANEQGERIGTIDDLILTSEDKVVVAVVSVGGFLGIGSKLVAVPFDQLRFGNDSHVVLAGASKDALRGMPGFTYGG